MYCLRMGLLCVRAKSRFVWSRSDSALFSRQLPEVKRVPPKNYAENYLYRKDKLRIMRTK